MGAVYSNKIIFNLEAYRTGIFLFILKIEIKIVIKD